MKNIFLLCVCSITLAGCGAATAPGTLPASVNQVTVVDEFARLDLLSGLKVGAIENLAENGLSSGDIAAVKAALASRLKREGLLFEDARPQSGVLSLQVLDVTQHADGTTVTVRMLLQDRQNWLVLGSADVIGSAPSGDVRGAALAATDTVLDYVIAKMKKPAA
jgi:hypothetical protein